MMPDHDLILPALSSPPPHRSDGDHDNTIRISVWVSSVSQVARGIAPTGECCHHVRCLLTRVPSHILMSHFPHLILMSHRKMSLSTPLLYPDCENPWSICQAEAPILSRIYQSVTTAIISLYLQAAQHYFNIFSRANRGWAYLFIRSNTHLTWINDAQLTR